METPNKDFFALHKIGLLIKLTKSEFERDVVNKLIEVRSVQELDRQIGPMLELYFAETEAIWKHYRPDLKTASNAPEEPDMKTQKCAILSQLLVTQFEEEVMDVLRTVDDISKADQYMETKLMELWDRENELYEFYGLQYDDPRKRTDIS